MNFRKISNNSSQGKNGTDETSMKKKKFNKFNRKI